MPVAQGVIRWGIVGCGDVAEQKSGPAFSGAYGSELVAACRRSIELATDFARRHHIKVCYANYKELIDDPNVDAVYVATPVGSHAAIALDIAEANKPAYIEKPMARNSIECDRIVSAFRKNDTPLFVAYYRRRLPRFIYVDSLLRHKAIGTVTGIRYHYGSPSHFKPTDPLPWRLDSSQSGGGLFLDVGCHALDIIDYLFGPIRVIKGAASNTASNYLVEDTVVMTFETQTGVLGSASWNFAQHCKLDMLELHGTTGEIALSVFGDTPIRITTNSYTREISVPNPKHIQQPLIQSIVDTLLGRTRTPCPSTGESAGRTSAVMDNVLSDYYGGRNDAFWERPDSWPGRRARQQR